MIYQHQWRKQFRHPADENERKRFEFCDQRQRGVEYNQLSTEFKSICLLGRRFLRGTNKIIHCASVAGHEKKKPCSFSGSPLVFDIFISYSHGDDGSVRRADVRRFPEHSCGMAPGQIIGKRCRIANKMFALTMI